LVNALQRRYRKQVASAELVDGWPVDPNHPIYRLR
jgi:hypothetical protein